MADTKIPNNEIECTRTLLCSWSGMWKDLVKSKDAKDLPSKFEISDNVCPNCGCKTFYEIS